MTTQFAFYFDSRACSGCKTCQVACKDRHNLPTGVLWRRVYEVSGGSWTQIGSAWLPGVFAYHLSLSCNHCENPACLQGCPSRAISKRLDGIVLIDPDRCMGCRYCSWACPYGAPQFDPSRGVMTKCNFCAEDIDAGLPPACVAACPMRALDFGERSEIEAKYGPGGLIFPLPETSLTGPALVITPHKDAQRASCEPAHLANREEVSET